MASAQIGRVQATGGSIRARRLSTERLGSVTIVGTVGAVGLLAALHVLDRSLDPTQRPTSEYAVGPFGYLMTAVFLLLSLATWALIAGLRRDLDDRARSRVGLAFLAAWAVGLLVAAAFPIDPEGAVPTTTGTVHTIAGPLTFLSLLVGIVLVSRRLQHDERWFRTRRIVWPLAALTVVEFIVGVATRAAGTGAGIAQRIMLLTVAIWFVVVAHRLRAGARGD